MKALVLTLATLAAGTSLFAQGKTPAEGIKVHGHWTIDVKNADGTLASHYEFENALQTDGQTALAKILSRGVTPLGWVVVMADSSGNPLLFLAESVLTAPNAFGQSPFPLPPGSGVITVTETTTSGKDTAVLQGSFQSPSALAISQVQSWLATQTTGQSATLGGGVFSQHAVSQPGTTQPILVNANQIVQVTVVFSFS